MCCEHHEYRQQQQTHVVLNNDGLTKRVLMPIRAWLYSTILVQTYLAREAS